MRTNFWGVSIVAYGAEIWHHRNRVGINKIRRQLLSHLGLVQTGHREVLIRLCRYRRRITRDPPRLESSD